jgi:DNA-binding response OmpR family regulator
MKHAKRILIADDDEGLVDALARRCEALNLLVERAYDGVSALRKIDALEPDLVILDVNMPSGSGLRICEMIAQDPYLKSIPIIILTGRTDGETMAACNRFDATYLLKGPDIWSQLEPLVVDRLGIDRASAGEQKQPQRTEVCRTDQSNSGPVSKDACLTQPSPRAIAADDQGDEEAPQIEEDRILDRYIETILAALGGNQAGADESRSDDSPPSEGNRPWVLCMDDDHDFAATLKRRLALQGIDVLHAFAGMDGYRCAFTHEAQAIILDQEMPNGDGEYILRRLKENPVTQDIPVIVLTARKDQALARRMYNLGAERFLTKPVDWGDLWAALRPFVQAEHEPAGLCGALPD